MKNVAFYRDENLPDFEVKVCRGMSSPYRHHFHEEFSFARIEKGASTFSFSGNSISVAAPSTVFIPTAIMHACNPNDIENWEYRMLFIKPHWFFSIFNNSKNDAVMSNSSPGVFYEQKHELIGRLLQTLIGKMSALEKETRAILILHQLFESQEEKEEHFQSYRQPESLQYAYGYINDHFQQSISLDTLGLVSGLSKHHLIRSFKVHYHTTPHAYQTLLRINFAKEELKKRRHIADIAQEVGFYDQSHFIKTFKHYVGTTPEIYQNHIKIF